MGDRRASLATQVKEMNDWIDALNLEQRPIGDWEGDVEIHSYYKKPPDKLDATVTGSQYDSEQQSSVDDGLNLQHIYEGGEPFERLLDHPSWYGHVTHYLGKASPFVFELFINIRGPGGFIGVHVRPYPILPNDTCRRQQRSGAVGRVEGRAGRGSAAGPHRAARARPGPRALARGRQPAVR